MLIIIMSYNYSKYRYPESSSVGVLRFPQTSASIILTQLKKGNRLTLRSNPVGDSIWLCGRYYDDPYDHQILHVLLTNDERRNVIKECESIIARWKIKFPF